MSEPLNRLMTAIEKLGRAQPINPLVIEARKALSDFIMERAKEATALHAISAEVKRDRIVEQKRVAADRRVVLVKPPAFPISPRTGKPKRKYTRRQK